MKLWLLWRDCIDEKMLSMVLFAYFANEGTVYWWMNFALHDKVIMICQRDADKVSDCKLLLYWYVTDKRQSELIQFES